jgi:hypothetical protein
LKSNSEISDLLIILKSFSLNLFISTISIPISSIEYSLFKFILPFFLVGPSFIPGKTAHEFKNMIPKKIIIIFLKNS